MATSAHCAYCFESLAASLEKRQPLNLAQVEDLWARYDMSDDDEDDDEVDPAADKDEDMSDASLAGVRTSHTSPNSNFKPAAISRLLSSSNASASASTSSSSIPSTVSSDAADQSSSTSKTSSSRSSLFSVPRRLRKSEKKASSTNEFPLFVTWNIISSHGSKNLRGCIGTFEAQGLGDGLRSYALTSAFDDSRFQPIPLRELPSLECGVTLLTDFEKATGPMAWEIGTHGIRISFTYQGRRYGATYLPDVAKEQGWTKEETIISLMKKAGWNGRRHEWRSVGDLQVVRYQGSKSTMDYATWKAWRDWAKDQKVLD